jgi:hypothetical protein
MKNHKDKLPLFSLRDIHMTKRAEAELAARAVTTATLLERYVTGDWSNLSAEDIKANRAAIHDGGRILASHCIAPTVRFLDHHRDRARQHDDSATRRILTPQLFRRIAPARRHPDRKQTGGHPGSGAEKACVAMTHAQPQPFDRERRRYGSLHGFELPGTPTILHICASTHYRESKA